MGKHLFEKDFKFLIWPKTYLKKLEEGFRTYIWELSRCPPLYTVNGLVVSPHSVETDVNSALLVAFI